MKRLQISSKEMALTLRIDPTLISKYRNQKRRISKELAQEISSYIILEFCSGYTSLQGTLKDLLEPYSEKSIEAYTPEELIPLLSDYLLDDSQMEEPILRQMQQKCWSTKVWLYPGLKGWIDVTNAFETDAAKRTGNEIYIGEFVYFDYEKPENYPIYSHGNEIYTKLIEDGHHLTLIISIKEEYQSYSVLIKWLQLYARDRISVYIADIPDIWDYQQSIVVEKGKQAYVNLDAHRDYEKDIYMRTTDPSIVAYYYYMMCEIKRHSRPLLDKVKIHQQMALQQYIEQDLFPGRTIYLLDSVPTYRNMSEEVLLEVLACNGVDGVLKVEIMRSFFWWQLFYTQNISRCIFDIQEIEKNMAQEYIVDYELSAIVGREIVVTKKQQQAHFQHLLYRSRENQCQIAYYPFTKLELVYRYLTMMVQGDNLLIMWSTLNCKNCLHYRDSSFIGGCERYLRQLWRDLPSMNKNRDSFRKQIGLE